MQCMPTSNAVESFFAVFFYFSISFVDTVKMGKYNRLTSSSSCSEFDKNNQLAKQSPFQCVKINIECIILSTLTKGSVYLNQTMELCNSFIE